MESPSCPVKCVCVCVYFSWNVLLAKSTIFWSQIWVSVLVLPLTNIKLSVEVLNLVELFNLCASASSSIKQEWQQYLMYSTSGWSESMITNSDNTTVILQCFCLASGPTARGEKWRNIPLSPSLHTSLSTGLLLYGGRGGKDRTWALSHFQVRNVGLAWNYNILSKVSEKLGGFVQDIIENNERVLL